MVKRNMIKQEIEKCKICNRIISGMRGHRSYHKYMLCTLCYDSFHKHNLNWLCQKLKQEKLKLLDEVLKKLDIIDEKGYTDIDGNNKEFRELVSQLQDKRKEVEGK